MDFWIYPLLVAAGFLAGFINTLAGAGSAISLAVLNLAGLPLDVANGTKRVAVLFQTATAVGRFKKQGKLDVKPHIGIILPAVIGGVVGALLAGHVSSLFLRRSVGVCMLLTLIPLFYKPSRWLEGSSDGKKGQNLFLRMVVFFFVGIYGGYIQMGVGVFLLTALVLVAGFDLVKANAIKVLIVFCITIPSLLIFALNGNVHWGFGLSLAVGSVIGAWVATHEAAKRGAPFIRCLLICVVIAAGVRYLFF